MPSSFYRNQATAQQSTSFLERSDHAKTQVSYYGVYQYTPTRPSKTILRVRGVTKLINGLEHGINGTGLSAWRSLGDGQLVLRPL